MPFLGDEPPGQTPDAKPPAKKKPAAEPAAAWFPTGWYPFASPPATLDEETILSRLEEVEKAMELPSDVMQTLVLILCPESKELLPAFRDGGPPLDPSPTDTLPGTAARAKVMAWRAERGYALWHPEDLVWDGDAADRKGLVACRLRNGVPSRMNAPLVVRDVAGVAPRPRRFVRLDDVPDDDAVLDGWVPAEPRDARGHANPAAKGRPTARRGRRRRKAASGAAVTIRQGELFGPLA